MGDDPELATPLVRSSSNLLSCPETGDSSAPSWQTLGSDTRSGYSKPHWTYSPVETDPFRQSDPPVNPFDDLISEAAKNESNFLIRPHLQQPPRNLAFPQRNPLSIYATPEDQKFLLSETYDEKPPLESPLLAAGSDGDDDDVLGDCETKDSGIVRQLGPNSWRNWSIRRYCKPVVLKWFLVLLALVLLCAFVVTIMTYYVSYAFKHPRGHWKGTLSASEGTSFDSGFNFTRYVNLGITNGNFWKMPLKEMEVFARFNGSAFRGYGYDTGFNMHLPSSNRRNATLPIEMHFEYENSLDPEHTILKKLYSDCTTMRRVTLDLYTHGKVEVWRRGDVGVTMGTIISSMDCDQRIMTLVEDAVNNLNESDS